MSLENALQERLESLQNEYAKGEAELGKLEQQAAELRQTLLRISGAIQVIQEFQVDQPADTED